MLRLLVSLSALAILVACKDSTVDIGKLSGKYELMFDRDASLLRNANIKSDSIELGQDGTYTQICIDQSGTERATSGQWKLSDDWIWFSSFHDCAGAWPSGPDSSASLHYSAGQAAEIVVSPDLNIIYVKH